jgi:hypothetical protein
MEALESASRRADSQTQVIANTALARNYYSLGDYSNCLSCLEDIKVTPPKYPRHTNYFPSPPHLIKK